MSSMTAEFDAIKKALSKLPSAIQDKVVVGATRAAAKVIADEAKERVPVDTGLLKISIDIAKAKKADTQNGHVKFYVVPKSKIALTAKATLSDGRSAKVKVKQFAWYAHMVEFGKSHSKPQPFLRPAYENSAEKSVKAFQDYALARVDKEIRKLAR